MLLLRNRKEGKVSRPPITNYFDTFSAICQFITSETELNCYQQKVNIRVASRAAVQRKAGSCGIRKI